MKELTSHLQATSALPRIMLRAARTAPPNRCLTLNVLHKIMKKAYLAIGIVLLTYTAHAANPDSAVEITRLLKAIEDRKAVPSTMPGTNKTSLEDQLVVELAKEVLRLKEENYKLSTQIEDLKKK